MWVPNRLTTMLQQMRDSMVEVELHWKPGTIIMKPHVQVLVLVLVLVSLKTEWLCSMLLVSSFEVFAFAYT